MTSDTGQGNKVPVPKNLIRFPSNIFTVSWLILRQNFSTSIFNLICLLLTVIIPNSRALNVGSYYLPSAGSFTPAERSRQFYQTPQQQQPLSSHIIQYRTSLPMLGRVPLASSLSTAKLLAPAAQNNNHSLSLSPHLPSLFNVPSSQQQQESDAQTLPPLPQTAQIVRTTSGRLAGRLVRADNGAVVALYLGVPFAKPPVGELRFRKPEHFVPSQQEAQKIINVTSFAPVCGAVKILPNAFDFFNPLRNASSFDRRNPQRKQSEVENVQVSEDCLYLNVYVPTNVVETAASNGAKIPVMIWIPGGDWNTIIAAQHQIDAVQFTAKTGIILVSINYRVGPFGFLTSNDKSLPGNYGLFDQAMAIGWVRQNIENFGGDSKEITLFGHSSGAMSISWHLFSPVMRIGSESMFKRAILQSGAYIVRVQSIIIRTRAGDLSLSFTENSQVFTNELGTRLSCHTDNSLILADCLRRVPEEALRRASQDVAPFGLGPVVDGEFIEDDPFNMLYAARSGADSAGAVKINARDVMIGTVFDEGSLALEILPLLTATPQSFMQNGLNQSEFDNLARLFLIGWLPQHRSQPQIYDLIIHKYKNFRTGSEAAHARRQNFMDLVGDVLINMGVDLLAEKLSESGVRVFAYQFQHRPSWSQYPSFIRAGHGDELAFVFGAAHDLSSVAAESSLSNRVMRAWTQFALSGDPNPVEPYASQTTWLPYGPILRHYYAWNLQLRSNEKALQNDLRAADIEFWYNIRARLGNFIQQCQLAAEAAPTSTTSAPMLIQQQFVTTTPPPALLLDRQPQQLPGQSSWWPNTTQKINSETQMINSASNLPPSTSLFLQSNNQNNGPPPSTNADLPKQVQQQQLKPEFIASNSDQTQQQVANPQQKQNSQQPLQRNRPQEQQTPFYQQPPPILQQQQRQVGRKYPVANLQANNETTTTTSTTSPPPPPPPQSPLQNYPPIYSASFLQTLPAAVTTLVPPPSPPLQDASKTFKISPSAYNNTNPWQVKTSRQYNLINTNNRRNPKIAATQEDAVAVSTAAVLPSPHHQVRAVLQEVFSTTEPPSATDAEKNLSSSSTLHTIIMRTDSARVTPDIELSSSRFPPSAHSKVHMTFADSNSSNVFDSTTTRNDESQPPRARLGRPATAADVVTAMDLCAESGWLIGSELSTQQAEIIIGALSVFSLTSLVLIVLLCFAVTGQRRKLRRRKFLLAADPKSATTTLYANHHGHNNNNHHQHQQAHNNNNHHYR